MAYKTLALILTDPASDEPALRAAEEIARRDAAHLDVVCLGVDETRFEPLPPAAALSIMDTGAAEARSEAEAIRVWATDRLDGVPNTAIDAVVLPNLGLERGLAQKVRYADAIVCAQPYGPAGTSTKVTTLEAALFGTGAPVIVVGQDADLSTEPARVLMAWDESEEALAAMRHAIPLMQQATRVDVVMVDPPPHSVERSDPGGSLSLMLSRHGIKAEVSILARTLPRIADCLIRFAKDHDSNVIVMGAYGHSRLRESMIGGPTRDMLESAAVPLFMAH